MTGTVVRAGRTLVVCRGAAERRSSPSRVAMPLLGQQRDQALDDVVGDGLMQREPYRALARQIWREYPREGGIDIGYRVHGDVMLPRRELHQAPAVQRHGRNLVADRLASLRHDAENPAPHLAQNGLDI